MIPFEQINRAALAAYPNLLKDLFPAGRIRGKEFVVGNLYGDAGDSLSINIQTGQWADFAEEARGGDPVSLFAALFHNGNQAAAAKDLGKRLGVYLNGSAPAPREEPKEQWEPGIPPPCAPVPDTSGFDHVHAYLDAEGKLIRYVYRKDARGTGKKTFIPFTWGVLNGIEGWHKKHPTEPRCLYGLDRLAASDKPAIVCEGEKAADAAYALFPDYPCISWSAGAQNVLRNDWSPLEGRKVIIWPDNDSEGHAAAEKLEGFLKNVASKVARLKVDDLPPKADAADVNPTDPKAWIRRRLPDPQKPDSNELPLVWFNDIKPCLDVLDFVQGVLVEGSGAVIYGDSNAGKTFWTTDLALHVAAGKRWNGRRVEQGGVVYCVLEGGSGFRNRVSAWRSENYLDGVDIPFAAIPSAMNLLDPAADTPRLIDKIKKASEQISVPIKLIIVDTLSRAMSGGNENAPDDMGALVSNMDEIRDATGACVLFVHHSGKDQARGARGHSLLRAAIDTEVEVVEAEDGSRTATVVKQRELKKGDVFGFGLRVVDLGKNRHGEDVTTCLVEPTDGSATSRRKLSGQNKSAYEALVNIMAEAGKSGYPGVPGDIPSVPEAWWRDRFYNSTMPGDNLDTKQKAFRRAAQRLISEGWVGMSSGRVWIGEKD